MAQVCQECAYCYCFVVEVHCIFQEGSIEQFPGSVQFMRQAAVGGLSQTKYFSVFVLLLVLSPL